MKKQNQRTLLGFALAIVGILLLLENLRLIPYYIITWQSVLIIVGVYQLVNRNIKGGLILLTIGSLLLVDEYWDVRFDDSWPLILIAVGAGFFLKSRGHRNIHGTSDITDQIDDLTIFGGTKQIVTNREFKGGKITSIFGGVDIDLREAALHEGKAQIDTFTIFGAFKAFVPPDWQVNTNVTYIFGGFSDKRVSPPDKNPSNELTITGVVIFGGGDLMN